MLNEYKTQCSGMKDQLFLEWIRDRLHFKYGENYNYDYMIRLGQIVDEVGRLESLNDAKGENGVTTNRT